MRKEKLFRKVNTGTHGVHHDSGGNYRWERNTKAEMRNEKAQGPMHSRRRNGRDYTPLFKFLLSRVGRDWNEIYSEAVARLDDPAPIFWIVARCEAEERPYVRIGESTYYSGLTIDAANRLALVAPDFSIDDLKPRCTCCTHTFNGIRFPASALDMLLTSYDEASKPDPE